MSEFQPPDIEEDRDAMFDAWFAQHEKNGMAVLDRDELHAQLDAAANDGYAEGRKDEREELLALIGWAYGKLHRQNFAQMDDALRLDEMKLLLMGAPS